MTSQTSSRNNPIDHDSSEDDFGRHFGTHYHDLAGPARQLVLSWSIEAVGHRPADYLARDLVFSATSRDRRMKLFRSLRGEDSPRWTIADTPDRPPQERKLIRQYRVFHYLHLIRCFELLRHARAIGDEVITQKLEAVIRCWPQGVQVSWGGPGCRLPQDVCQLAWLCPFCYARNIDELFSRVEPRLCNGPPERFLIAASVKFPESNIPAQERPRQSHAEFVRASLRRVRLGMIDYLRQYGAEGGIVGMQVGPILLTHRRWVSGEAEDETDQDLEFSVSALGEFYQYLGGEALEAKELEVAGMRLLPRVAIQPVNPVGLRVLMAGHSRTYTGRSRLHSGAGVFGWPSLLLSTYSQWERRYRLTAHGHLFDMWGTWKGRFTTQRPNLILNGRHRPRQRQMSRINVERKAARQERLRAIIPEGRPIWTALRERLGRTPGRKELRSALESQGILVSERQVRSLVEFFKREVASEGWRNIL